MSTRKIQTGTSPGVTVMVATHRPEHMNNLLNNYLRQKYPIKELIVILNNNEFDLEGWQHKIRGLKDIKVFYLQDHVTLGNCYNFAAGQAQYEYVAKFDDDDYYGPLYLQTSMELFQCTNADIVGKLCRFIFFAGLSVLAEYCPGPEYDFVSYVVGATMIIRKEVLHRAPFPELTCGEDSEFQKTCVDKGFNIFAGNRHHYVTIRSADPTKHTFRIDDDVYLGFCRIIAETPDFLTCLDTLTGSQMTGDRG